MQMIKGCYGFVSTGGQLASWPTRWQLEGYAVYTSIYWKTILLSFFFIFTLESICWDKQSFPVLVNCLEEC